MNRIKRMFSMKALMVVVFALIQIFIWAEIYYFFKEFYPHAKVVLGLLSLTMYFTVIMSQMNPAFKIGWITMIMVAPVFGTMFFFYHHTNILSRKLKRDMNKVNELTKSHVNASAYVVDFMKNEDIDTHLLTNYLLNYNYYPPDVNTTTEYYPLGEVKQIALLNELKKAQKFIFVEYFILGDGQMLEQILEILFEKSAQGVEVRIMYDEMGCLGRLSDATEKRLVKNNIKVTVFNPMIPILSTSLNHRNHRKIVVIDGKVGFIGGINIGDEYINLDSKLGHWKDTAIKLDGDGVWNLTVMFLSMWNGLNNTDEDFEPYRFNDSRITTDEHFTDYKLYSESFVKNLELNGLVQCFYDNSLDNESLSENVYMSIINRAKHYVYITTPYLILTNELSVSLQNAAKSGVDVRIIVPGIPDKKFVYYVTESYFYALINAGVKIYKYTPGFMHAKSIVSDDKFAVVGSVNMDYRSMYLNMESACFMYRTSIFQEIKEDLINCIDVSENVTIESVSNVPFFKKIYQALLRVFAPLM